MVAHFAQDHSFQSVRSILAALDRGVLRDHACLKPSQLTFAKNCSMVQLVKYSSDRVVVSVVKEKLSAAHGSSRTAHWSLIHIAPPCQKRLLHYPPLLMSQCI